MDNNSNSEKPDAQLLLNQIVLDYMKEQRRKRLWRILSRSFFLLVFIFLIYELFSYKDEEKTLRQSAHVGIIDVTGTIFDSEGSSADDFAKGMKAAYKSSGLKALIVRINSPGGSPVQADYMYSTLKYYREKYPQIKTYAVCVDMCASAAYYIAAGADEIYANPASLVGSIGVLYNGFGFVDTLQKLGMTRRLHTAGKNKGFLDPFSPENPEQTQLLQTMLDEIHQLFISRVKEGRGNRLKIDQDTFSGLFWTGEQAKARGLIDGFATTGQLAREKVQVEKAIDYTHKPSVLERFSKNLGTALADEIPVALGIKPGILS
ncbi:S49 family peptidase [Legionella jordanis]|uniref:Signal peptide peptidase n=1 Tax=Legionella jordanis TaxID=456 RepID=A0A0W0VA09_9GAMM|nr:S49 family peptidase [Legionella jordanis]KTD16457.1 signal peptide peptidase [Legionella jordanis]RMX03993.1 S49 family peptidase [Legionella jordanis]RMX15283.1 S49 family peptidase [Legionella jordanis]VEH12083.1 signal peptide peptidase [Legionella jordanis]HAT8712616.1 S49 family peptidase [Legionella jordanis]